MATLVQQKRRAQKLPWAEVFASTSETSRAVARAVRDGAARKIGPRLYTTNLTDSPDAIVRRNLWQVVSLVAARSVIGFRTALEPARPPDGTVFLTGEGRHDIELPGLHIRVVKGPGPLAGDMSFLGSLYMASRPRALLESLKPSRKGKTVSRGLPQERIEEILEAELRSGGEAKLNRIRDEARAIAPALEAEAAFAQLSQIIGALLGSQKAKLSSRTALARIAGMPYDAERVKLFEALCTALVQRPAASRPDALPTDEEFSVVSFFDAYFSNYIEGTQFEVEEARAIVFNNVIPRTRPQDAHDVLGTFRLVGYREWMRNGLITCADYNAFESRVVDANATIMAGRPEKRPGEFKETQNVAGQTVFVAPELVRGTLRQGYELVRGLTDPFARAVALMFVLAEVHPFDDGNGRVARAFMNAELVSSGERRIMIPPVYRDEYLTGLRVLSRQRHPAPFIAAMDFAQRYTAGIDFSNYETASAALAATNAFAEPSEEVRLRLPTFTPFVSRGGVIDNEFSRSVSD